MLECTAWVKLASPAASYCVGSSPEKVNLIWCGPLARISDIKLIRRYYTYLIQKAEKGILAIKSKWPPMKNKALQRWTFNFSVTQHSNDTQINGDTYVCNFHIINKHKAHRLSDQGSARFHAYTVLVQCKT